MKHKATPLIVIFTLILVAATAPLHARAEKLEIHYYRARLGPVYQKLADGRVVKVTIYVTYPDTLAPMGPGRGLGRVNFTVVTNWTGLWDGILTVMVVDPGYRIDNTTFKPVESMNAWASGGAVLGSGNIHAAGDEALHSPVANASATIWPHTRFVEAKPGRYEAQYFFKARLALFDESGSKVLGGDILVYTESSSAPKVVLVKPPKEAAAASAAGAPGGGGYLGFSLGVAAAAVAAYLAAWYVFSRIRTKH